jgi:hypothetical protein
MKTFFLALGFLFLGYVLLMLLCLIVLHHLAHKEIFEPWEEAILERKFDLCEKFSRQARIMNVAFTPDHLGALWIPNWFKGWRTRP